MNITWEEIRDIIEEEIYIGSGTTLGVSDAAKAIKARIEAVEQSVQSDACPACDGIGSMKLFGLITLNCSTCHGSGKRR